MPGDNHGLWKKHSAIAGEKHLTSWHEIECELDKLLRDLETFQVAHGCVAHFGLGCAQDFVMVTGDVR